MSIQNGTLYPYAEYRAYFQREHEKPLIWKGADITAQLDASKHAGRHGTFMLAKANTANSCELFPGAAIAIRVVKAGRSTPTHAHSWWHFALVLSGTGTISFDELKTSTLIHKGDITLIPAWCMHRIENESAQEDLVLLDISNIPDLGNMTNLLAKTLDGKITVATPSSA